jgi:hypothetical protein
MKTYRITNNNDANDCFNVVAESEEGAAFAALAELGWSVLLPQGNKEEKDPDQYEFDF